MAEEEDRLLLLIDDDPARIRLISSLASQGGWRTLAVRGGDGALAALHAKVAPDAVMIDGAVAGEDSCRLIGDLRAASPDLSILFLTGSASPLLAVQAMRAGAADYLVRPIAAERLLYALQTAIERRPQRDELAPLAEKIDEPLDFDRMIGSAPGFRAALARAAKAARGHGPVLITGETGTGKEILARAIHSASPRARAPLRVLHNAGMAESHLESALYGHEKGAFPGAFERRQGALEEADGGTLLINDVERLPAVLQQRLARTMATGEVRPIGSRHGFRIDVRILATACPAWKTPETLQTQTPEPEPEPEPDVWNGSSTFRIALPPLRERPCDIPALSRHFLSLIGEQPGLRRLGITDEALALLAGYRWPGNLRQLQAVLFRAAVFCDKDALTPLDFPQLLDIVGETAVTPAPGGGGVTLFGADGHLRPLEDIEADVIRLAIGHYHGRMSEVARRLGIGRSTLYRKLGDLGIDDAA